MISIVCCARIDVRGPRHHSPTAVAIVGVAGVLVAGVRVDAAVEFAFGRGTIAGGVVPGGRSPETATREIINSSSSEKTFQ